MADPGRQYELVFERRPNYLYARISAARIDDEMAITYLRQVIAKCRKSGYNRLVLERNIPQMLSPGSLYFTTKVFRQLTEGIKVAFINPHENIDNGMNFAVLMATNIGAEFSLQPNIESAEEWLQT
jgi:hypothetical protein